jgi:hypothetical protein
LEPPITPAFSGFEATMTSKSLWMDVDVMPAAGSLPGNVDCDVAVIGSGIAGISTAYELCKLGMSVMVIDRGPIAGGMTSRTSAHLAPLCDDLVSEMMKIKGQEATKLFCDSQDAAIDRIEEIQEAERIDVTSGGSTGICFRDATCRPTLSMGRWMRCAGSARPCTASSAYRSMAARTAMCCAIPGRRPSIP